jgi:hypothetical protein
MSVLAAYAWPSNAEMIAGAARLGYLRPEWLTLDATYGKGIFWKHFRPERLIRQDLNPTKAPDGVVDFRKLPYADNIFDAVVFDPPYALNGTPAMKEFDESYGIDVPTRWQDRMGLMTDGLVEQIRVTKVGGYILAKCQDQVCSGKIRWQTDVLTNLADVWGCEKVDEMILLGKGRPQPKTRPHKTCGGKGCDGCDGGQIEVIQQHAAYRPSTLLIFRRGS